MNKTLRIFVIFSALALLLSACGVGGAAHSRAQTEKLRGAWSLQHPTASPAELSIDLVGELEAFSHDPSMFYTFGQVGDNHIAYAYYHPKYEVFVLGYGDDYRTHFYNFKFLDADSISGCYEQIVNDEPQGCNYFSGTRAVASVTNSADVQATSSRTFSPADAKEMLETYRALRSR